MKNRRSSHEQSFEIEESIPLNPGSTIESRQVTSYVHWRNSIRTVDVNHRSGNIALREATYLGLYRPVPIYLTNRAFDSLNVLSHQFTPSNKSSIEQIKQLLSEPDPLVPSPKQIADTDTIDWYLSGPDVLEKRRQFREQIDLYKTYNNENHLVTKLLIEITDYYLNEYLKEHEQFSADQIEKIERSFKKAIEEQDYIRYFIEAYTSTTNSFHRVLNEHLALYILDYFDIDSYHSTPKRYRLINCLVHIVTLLINHPEIHKYQYKGRVHRGLSMKSHELNQRFRVDNHILNRAFLSTSKTESIARLFAGSDVAVQQTSDCYQQSDVSVLLTYSIRQSGTGIDIQGKSTIPDEEEVLILPFSVFKVKNIVEYGPNMNRSIQYRIEFEECADDGEELIEDQPTTSALRKRGRSKYIYGSIVLGMVIAIVTVVWILQARGKAYMALSDEAQQNDTQEKSQLNHSLREPFQGLVKVNESTTTSFTERIETTTTQELVTAAYPLIGRHTKWLQAGISLTKVDQNSDDDSDAMLDPYGLDVDADQNVVITDYSNHRVVEWALNANREQLVAGGRGRGDRADQLNYPTDVFVDRKTKKLIICDRENRRVVEWPRRGGSTGETLISMVKCFGLTMDDEGFLYVSDLEKHEVRRWRIGESQSVVVAGGNGQGSRPDQLNSPHFIFVTDHQSVYVSDWQNHRVMKWTKDAQQGVVVAGGHGDGTTDKQLSFPEGVWVDHLESVYVVDHASHRVMRWLQGATEGTVVLGGHGDDSGANHLNLPMDMSFDLDDNIYVADWSNHRVQKFYVIESTLE